MVHASVRLVLAFVLLAAPLSAAQSPSGGRHTRASLVAELDAVQAGTPLTLGIRLQMEPGWHTYWRNPGDSGLPTRVKWTLPDGFEATGIQWPYPESFAAGPLVSYGYEHEVLLFVPIRVPASLAAQDVRFAARVDWLECQEVCLPGKAELSLSLPVRPVARPGSEAARFAEARRRLPRVDPGWRASSTAVDQTLVLGIRAPGGVSVQSARFFPHLPGVIDHARPQPLQKAAAEHRLTLVRDPNGPPVKRLAGVLVIEAGGAPRALEVDVPIRAAATPRGQPKK